ncbi:alpha/beta hydrolase [Spirillospora sp. NPDC052269]
MFSIRKAHGRRIAASAVIAAGTLGAFAIADAANATPRADRKPKPTIVLEHGAFADSSSWNGVIKKLRHDGFPVVAAANPLRSPASDASALRGVISHVKGPVILVGHSYGGSVISAAGAKNPQVKALVYVAAFLPEPGESAQDLAGLFPGSTLPDAVEPVPVTGPDGAEGTDLYIRQDKFHHQFAADVPAGQAALMAAEQRPITEAALAEKATVAAWHEKPSWDVIAKQDMNIPVAAQRFMAQRAHAHVTEVNASHAVAVSHPGVVASAIEQAARATR